MTHDELVALGEVIITCKEHLDILSPGPERDHWQWEYDRYRAMMDEYHAKQRAAKETT